MKSLYDVPAPAKLNLFLHITGRRADGYHLLQSAFMLIDWCDTLHFELRTDGCISREDLTTALPPDDLIVRAATALQKFSATSLGTHICVAKSIPAQAGMGGGSSDAASCLMALNRLWNLNLPLSILIKLGLQLGADVPFFLHGQNAWVEGIGEKIQALNIPQAQFVVVKPQAGLATNAIFSDPALKRDTETAIISGFAAYPFDFGRNDLQAVAQKLCPDVTTALNWLAVQGLRPRMTGSGSAVFAHLAGDKNAKEKFADIDLKTAPKDAVIKICNNLDTHPLLGWVAE
jgi:4-diphosphocytidyl-2-C-methyl-D-erythritol kinase